MFDVSVIERVLSRALARGGEHADIYWERSVSRFFEFEDGVVKRPATGLSSGAAIRLIHDDRAVTAVIAEPDEDALLAGADRLAAAISGVGSGEKRLVLDEGPARSMSAAEMPVAEWSADRKIELLREADVAARAESDEIKRVRINYREQSKQVLIGSALGVRAVDERDYLILVVQAIGQRNGTIRSGISMQGKQRGMELLAGGEAREMGIRAARQAVTNLDARPAPRGPMAVVLNCGWGGVLFHEACGHGLEADTILSGSSVYEGMIGERVASELVTAVDDGSLHGEWGSYGYDDEGVPSRRNVLIERGILKGYLQSVMTARQAGVEPTGNGRRENYRYVPFPRMSNTFIAPGDQDPAEIIAATDYGLFARDLRGGQVNPASGDFVFVVSEGYMIRNGKLAEPVQGATLIGNGPAVLKRVDMVGSDFGLAPGMCGKMDQNVPAACGQPTLRISEITVGGTDQGGA